MKDVILRILQFLAPLSFIGSIGYGVYTLGMYQKAGTIPIGLGAIDTGYYMNESLQQWKTDNLNTLFSLILLSAILLIIHSVISNNWSRT